jgi:hypothetical protein
MAVVRGPTLFLLLLTLPNIWTGSNEFGADQPALAVNDQTDSPRLGLVPNDPTVG